MKIILTNLKNKTISLAEFEKLVRGALLLFKSEISIRKIAPAFSSENIIEVEYSAGFNNYKDDAVLMNKIRELLAQHDVHIVAIKPSDVKEYSYDKIKAMDLLVSHGLWNHKIENKAIYYIDAMFAAELADNAKKRQEVVDYYPMPLRISLDGDKPVQYMGELNEMQSILNHHLDGPLEVLDISSHALKKCFFDENNPYHLLVWAIESNQELKEALSCTPNSTEQSFLESIYNRVKKAATAATGRIKMEILPDSVEIMITRKENATESENIYSIDMPPQEKAREDYISRLRGC